MPIWLRPRLRPRLRDARPILRKKKCSRLRRELLQVQAEKLAYVSSALFGPYVCLGNLTTTMFRLGPQQRINIGPGFGLCFGPGLGPGISAQVPGSMRARVDCRPFASAAGEKRVTDPHHRHLSPYVRKHLGSSRFRASRGRVADKNTACSQEPHTRLELQPHQSRQGSG